MHLLEKLLDALPEEPAPVRSVIIGVHWTMVCSKHCGLASTIVGFGPHGHSQMRDVGELHGKNARELARWVLSENLLEASVGMAALNSLLEIDETWFKQVNAADVIAEEALGKNLAVIGHFPFVERIKPLTRNCWVIEKRPFGDDFPEEAALELIPQADVVAISGTAFINHTMDALLALCQPHARVMILGPSTPLSPLIYQYGVHFLSGSRIVDQNAAALTIQQGASFPQVKGVKLVTMSQGW